jgi:hypothetical protein
MIPMPGKARQQRRSTAGALRTMLCELAEPELVQARRLDGPYFKGPRNPTRGRASYGGHPQNE